MTEFRTRISIVVFLALTAASSVTDAYAQPGGEEEEEGFRLLENFGTRPEQESVSQAPALAEEASVLVPLVTTEAALELPSEGEFDAQEYQDLRLLPSIETLRFSLPESVCGVDERSPVQNVSQAPYTGNCLLLLILSDGSRARGTGWLLDPTTVVTAGHCVHDGDGGSYFSEVEVIPGAYVARVNGADVLRRPFGSQRAATRQLRASTAWRTDGRVAKDYGVILLDAPFRSPSGASPSTYEMAALDDAQLANAQVRISGYPGDKPTGTQWEHDGPIGVETERLRYMIDTMGGQSGSAVLLLGGSQPQVVGIHNYGGCSNRCTRITAAVLGDIGGWQGEAQPEEREEEPKLAPRNN